MILKRGFLSFEPLFHDIDVFFRISVGNQAIRAVMEAYMEDYYFPHLAKALATDVPELSAGDGGGGNMRIQGDNLEALKPDGREHNGEG
jgi:hypothetical protein